MLCYAMPNKLYCKYIVYISCRPSRLRSGVKAMECQPGPLAAMSAADKSLPSGLG